MFCLNDKKSMKLLKYNGKYKNKNEFKTLIEI